MAPRNPFPAFQFYPRDWLADERVSLLTAEQKGALIDLRAHAWLGDPPCTIPADDVALARLSRLGERWAEVGGPIKTFFEPMGDRLRDPALHKPYRDAIAFRKERSKAGKKGAEQRWVAVTVTAYPKAAARARRVGRRPEQGSRIIS